MNKGTNINLLDRGSMEGMESVQTSGFSRPFRLCTKCVDTRCHVARLLAPDWLQPEKLDTFLKYSNNMVCNYFLSDTPVVFNRMTDEFAMIIICGSDRTTTAFFFINYGFLELQSRITHRFAVELSTTSSHKQLLNGDESW